MLSFMLKHHQKCQISDSRATRMIKFSPPPPPQPWWEQIRKLFLLKFSYRNYNNNQIKSQKARDGDKVLNLQLCCNRTSTAMPNRKHIQMYKRQKIKTIQNWKKQYRFLKENFRKVFAEFLFRCGGEGNGVILLGAGVTQLFSKN